MEYITSGDRIAVENFEIGSLYKVTFLNETEVYFMCCGIGKDFVMLMSNEPRLFSLTMLSAAEVDAIDEYTPLPPPPTNLLQYQTGEPPFTFTTTDTELFSWYIKGPAGDKTANLWNEDYTGISDTLIYKPLYVGSGDFTLSSTMPAIVPQSLQDLFFLAGDVSSGASSSVNGVYEGRPITVTAIDGYVTIAYRHYSASYPDVRDYNTMLNAGSTPLPYEPFGYKIPISCNTTISNIYIEEALGENDILHSTETDYIITTEIGENILRIQGETQPSRMQIVYKWEFEG